MLPTHQDSVAYSPVKQDAGADEILERITSGKLWIVNPRRRNGIVIYRKFYAVFAGPGAAVGGLFDQHCSQVIPLGKLSLLTPASHEDQQKAIRIRLQWVRLTQNFTDRPVPIERAQMILEQFKMYFDQEIVARVPDEAFAQLVGVFPETVHLARRSM
ncbi:hypothetical protein [Leptolyngbya sp. PCC 6406]|uniref:hypothetical protein n=1 Tax=Leptolyngbya sp. PCC 6406 TaxID=1173264 RepID=UPI0002ACDA4E|nr:hypothetical protein [Leptolyngbya sp. PCC 6406]